MPTYLLNTANPTNGQALWTDSTLIPTSPSGPAGGDLTGTYPNPTVDGLQGQPISAVAPVNGQILTYTAGQWTPTTPPAAPLLFQGTWDASTGLPPVPAATTAGEAWVVNVAGNTNLGGITDWQVGDWAVYGGGATWFKLDNTSWDTTGNVVGASQFIGSTNAADVVLKRNNVTQLTLSGTGLLAATGLDMANNVISNIGAAGTDFTAGGGLTLASTLTVSAGGASITGATTIATGVGNLSISSAGASTINLGNTNLTLGAGVYSLGAGVWNIAAQTITATGNLSFSGADIVLTPTNALEIRDAKQLRLYEPSGSGTEYTSFRAQAQAASIDYVLPAAQGAASTFLRNDGAGNLSWVAAGLSFFTEAQSTVAPNNTIYANSLTAVAAVANADFVIIPKGIGSILAAVPDNTATGGNKRGTYSVDLQLERNTAAQVASGNNSAIIAGVRNTVSGSRSGVFTGSDNTVANQLSTIAGGGGNTINSTANGYSFIGGGTQNSTTGDYSTIAGGRTHTASANYAFVGGGQSNTASTNTHSAVVGGFTNLASGLYSFVGGGANNQATGERAFVGGGGNTTAVDRNTATATAATVVGGENNDATGTYTFIGGGTGNQAIGTVSTISGGAQNTAGQEFTFIGGGRLHQASASHACVLGGRQHTASGLYSTIGGGQEHTASATYTTVSGGAYNRATSSWATVSGGGGSSLPFGNTATATAATVSGGQTNNATGGYSAVSGGQNNTSGASYSAIPGGLQASTLYTGEVAHASGQFAAAGDAQNSFVVLRRVITVAAAATDLTLDGAAPAAGNVLALANNSMFQFFVKVGARDTGATGQFAWWDISGGIGRDGTIASTAIIGVNVTNTGNSGGNSAGWTCVVQAENVTNGALQILVSAPAGTGPVRFAASVQMIRVA